jgi:hypothetical protein
MKTDIETYQIDILKLRELNIDENLPGYLYILNKDVEPSKKIETFFTDIERFDGVYFQYNENKVLLSKDRIKKILYDVKVLNPDIEYDKNDKVFEEMRDLIIKELYPNYSEEQLKSVYPNKDQIQKICMESAAEGFTKDLPLVRSKFPSDTPLSPVEVIIQDNGDVELHRQITNSLIAKDDLSNMLYGSPNTTVYKGKLNQKAEYIELKIMDQSLDDQFLKKNKEGILKGCISQVTDKKDLELFNTQTKVTVQLLNDLKTEEIKRNNFVPNSEDPAFLNHENGKVVLKETLYNSKFPLDKKKAMLDIIETIPGFENIKQEFVENSVMYYLKDAFKKHEGKDQKKDISEGLYNEIIDPLKMMFDKSDNSKLFKDLEPNIKQEFIQNSVVHYLNDEFKKHEGKDLTKDQKKDILYGLYNEIIDPLKIMFDKSDYSKLFKNVEALINFSTSDTIETKKGFENIKQEFIQNSVMHYLNDEFKKHEGKNLTKEQKKDISDRLYNEIIEPLKMMFDKSEHSKLFKDLEPSNVEKLVRRCAREDTRLKHGFYGSLKTLIRTPLDGFGLEKDILSDKKLLNSFKKHVSQKTLDSVIPSSNGNNIDNTK